MAGGFGAPVLDLYGALGGLGDQLTRNSEIQRKRDFLTKLGGPLQSGDYAGAARMAFNVGEADTGLALLKMGREQARDDRQQQALTKLGTMLPGLVGGDDYGDLGSNPAGGTGAGTGTAGPSSARALPSFADTSGDSGNYVANLFKRESGNNPNARAKTSSATGLGQFTTGTWNSLARSRPELGLTPVAGGQDGRTDPEQMLRATQAHTADNEALLRKSGLPVNDATRYSLHFLGSGGGRRFVAGTLANPDRPAVSLVGPEQAAANRTIFFNRDGSPKSAGTVMNDFARSFGGSAPAPAPRRVQVAALGDVSGLGGALPAPVASMFTEAPVGGPDVPQQVKQTGSISAPSSAVPSSGVSYGYEAPTVPGSRRGTMSPREQAAMEAEGRRMEAEGIREIEATERQAAMAARSAPALQGGGTGGLAPRLPAPVPAASVVTAPPSVGRPDPSPTDAPTLPAGPAGGARVMTMPGARGSAPAVSEADVQSLDPATAARVRSIQGQGPSQRLAVLGQLMSMDLPEGAQRVVGALYQHALSETKLPEGVREFMWARRQGLTQARTPAEYARESKGPTVVSPGSSVLSPDGRSVALTVPDRENTKLREEIAAREQALTERGLDPNTPQNRQWVLSGKWPREDAQPLTATDKRAVLEADEGVMMAEAVIGNLRQAKAISKQAYEGPTAGFRGQVSGYFGSEAGLATTELDNLVTTNALSQLKAIFGAAPTEGERKILLDIQGSSSLPDAARQKIYDRAIAMAERRLGMNRERVNELRGGTFFRPGGGESSPAPAGGSAPRALPAPSASNRPGAGSAADRFGELTAGGMSKADAYRQLQSEGY